MLIFKKELILDRVMGPVLVPNFHLPNPDSIFAGSRNLEPILDPVRPVSSLDPPSPNRIRVQDWVPDFFAQPYTQILKRINNHTYIYTYVEPR